MKHTFIALSMSLSILGFWGCKPKSTSTENEKLVLTPTEFEQKMAALTDEQLLDVRTNEEVASAKLENAMVIDFNGADFQKEAVSKLDKTKPVMVYCYSGSRSKAAADILRNQGYKVYELEGGIASWKQENKAVTTSNANNTSNETNKVGEEGVMSLADFKQKIAGEKPVLVDFSAVWCLPCKKMKPTIDKLAAEMQKDVDVIMIDVDKSEEIATAFKIEAMPTLMLFKKSAIIWQKVGLTEEPELREALTTKR